MGTCCKMRLFYFPVLINAGLIMKPEREISELKTQIENLNQKVEALLLNGKHKNGGNQDIDRCRKICDGHGKTRWKQHDSIGIYGDIDMSDCNFIETPTVVSSLAGDTRHWSTTGGSAPYYPTALSFRIYVKYFHEIELTPEEADRYGWHVHWVAVGKVC